jgi:hypothetical protein
LGDLKTYAGPGIGLGVAEMASISAWVGAVVGMAAPIGKSFGSYVRAKREVAHEDFFFLYEVERRAGRWNAHDRETP